MPARTLTDVQVRAVKAGPDERLVIYDAKARGLCLRVTARTRSWSFIYRPMGAKKQKRYTIGDYPAWSLAAAREKALMLRRMVQDGGDPVLQMKIRREALTLSRMAERFITQSRGRMRSSDTYEALLRRDVLPLIGDRHAGEITRAEIGNLLDKIATRAPVVSNRVHTVLSSLYSWAVSEGLVLSHPVHGLRKRHDEVARDRVLADDEIRRFWKATETMAPAWRDVLRLILLTAQRSGECAGIQAEEVDLRSALWVLPPERVKNGHRHIVPLVGEALAIVRRLTDGTGQTGPLILSPRRHEINSLDVAKAVQRFRHQLFGDAPAKAHDIRRTAATLMGRLEIDQMTIARVLNHAGTTRATVTGSTYDRHTYEPQMRRALEALDGEIRHILTGPSSTDDVVPMTRG